MIQYIKKSLWNPVMSSEHNPFKALPPIVRYQLMTILAMMWSFIFCAMIGWMLWFPFWIVGHIILLSLGAIMTNHYFYNANGISHRDLYRSEDGRHARHDDIWGG